MAGPPRSDGRVRAIPGLSRESQKRQGWIEVKAREWRPSAKLCFWQFSEVTSALSDWSLRSAQQTTLIFS
jgi:hypothetical protein